MRATTNFSGLIAWSEYVLPNNRKLWFKGYLYAKSIDSLILEAADLSENQAVSWLRQLDGHFALVLQTPDWTLAAVDKVRSIPLFYTWHKANWELSDCASKLTSLLEGNVGEINQEAALSIAMSGYAIGDRTLYSNMQVLAPGTGVLFAQSNSEIVRYDRYMPWQTVEAGYREYLTELSEVTLSVLSNMLESIGDRQIVIPLSAGHDSRLIASGLKHLGAKNVKCFTYGVKDNFEASVSCKVAERLGYEWRFVQLSHGREKRFYASDEFRDYWYFADSCMSVPYIQGLSAMKYLKESGWIDADAVLINGNTGDFISGGHIPKTICSILKATREEQIEYLVSEAINKHFSLWGRLKTPENLTVISQLLRAEFQQINTADVAPENIHGLYEYVEFLNRQSKYIIANQRIYEFYGHEWRLPLWSDAYLRFWKKVPVQYKVGQKLYKEMLKENNWGGVWDGDIIVNMPDDDVTIRPKWLIPLRFTAKLFFAPFGARGKRAWRRFEMNLFYYWRDVGVTVALFPYLKMVFDKRQARNVVAYLAEKYLTEKNIKVTGLNY